MTHIILASASPYRKQLLERLGIAFDYVSANIDETPHRGETPPALVERLSREKAAVIAKNYPDAWIIGSDQTAAFEGNLIGKPGSVVNAEAQLKRFSGKEVHFYTSVCLINRQIGFAQSETNITRVKFRTLNQSEILRYVQLDNPLDCAGSFKCESLGITLFDEIESKDPTALIGLPLIAVARLLRQAGILTG